MGYNKYIARALTLSVLSRGIDGVCATVAGSKLLGGKMEHRESVLAENLTGNGHRHLVYLIGSPFLTSLVLYKLPEVCVGVISADSPAHPLNVSITLRRVPTSPNYSPNTL